MPNVNIVTLAGHLTRDVETKQTEGGLTIAKFGLAINDRVKKGGEWVDKTCFVDIVCFGKTAEIAGQYLSKGSAALVTGRLDFEQWEANDGSKRSKLLVVADKMQMLGGKGGKSEAEPAPAKSQSMKQNVNRKALAQRDEEDDCPF